jgi:gluconolactonase
MPAKGEVAMADFELLDDAFGAALAPDPRLRLIASGFQFTEGPVWLDDGQCLLFSDIPADTIYRWKEGDVHSAWRKPSHNSNGNTTDLQGRLVTCEHGSRRVTRTEKDGSVTVLASTYGGKRLNSPNDVVVKSDGTIWFTDPPYGIKPEQQEQPKCFVFRLDAGAKEPTPVAEDLFRPNGLAFSPDERLLYVANSDRAAPVVRRFRVRPDDTLEGGETLFRIDPGVPDGFRCDAEGRIFCTAGDGVHVFSPEGKLLGRIRTPQTAANCTFGGPDHKTLFITAVSSVWAVRLNVRGAR